MGEGGKGSKTTKTIAPYYVELSNYYFNLAGLSADPRPEDDKQNESRFKKDAAEQCTQQQGSCGGTISGSPTAT